LSRERSFLVCREKYSVNLAILPTIVDLPASSRESILDRDFGVLVAPIVRRRVTYDDVFIRWHCQQNVDLKACSVSMVITWCDHGHPAGRNATIVHFEPLEFMLNSRANVIRRLASLECYLKRNLHLSLSWRR
jgi:hypothetical protein